MTAHLIYLPEAATHLNQKENQWENRRKLKRVNALQLEAQMNQNWKLPKLNTLSAHNASLFHRDGDSGDTITPTNPCSHLH